MAAEMGTNGYFSGPYLLGKFTPAHATVALDPNQSVPIHLNADRTMPEEVILVVDAPRRPPVVPGEECQ